MTIKKRLSHKSIFLKNQLRILAKNKEKSEEAALLRQPLQTYPKQLLMILNHRRDFSADIVQLQVETAGPPVAVTDVTFASAAV